MLYKMLKKFDFFILFRNFLFKISFYKSQLAYNCKSKNPGSDRGFLI
jgi:hypothetical protein